MTPKEDKCRCKTHGKESCMVHWINPNHPHPATPKEGPLTLKEFWEFTNDVVWAYGEETEFVKSYDILERLSKKAASYKMSLESVELDENRRAALETERDRYKVALQKLLDLANTEYHPHSYTVNGSDVKKISSDALTPTKEDK